MINFNKNKLINETLDKFYETFSHTLDTSDYVPEKFNEKISKYIYKNMKKTFSKIDKEDRKYQRDLIKKEKQKIIAKKKQLKEQKKLEEKPKSKFASFFSLLFHKKRRKIVKEKAESEQSERINSESGLCSALDNVTSDTNLGNTNPEQ